MTSDALLSYLREVVGTENVLTGPQVSARATHFWDASPLTAAAIIRPASTAETAAVLKLCHEAGQPVVTRGGSTGLVDGHRSTSDDIVLSLERMHAIDAVDVTGRTLTVEAGGLSVLRYGMTREQVLGLEVVLADGTTLSSMNRMMKNNAGFDLKHLFIGSEGTLGVITRAVLRLRSAMPAVDTALLAFDDFQQVTDTLSHLGLSLNGTLDAFEVIWQPFYQLNTNPDIDGTRTAPLARDHAFYAIVESRSAAPEQTSALFERAMQVALSNELMTDAVIAQSERERQNIWHIREHIDIALQHDPVFVYDTSLPIADMHDYVTGIQARLRSRWPQVILYVYGHLADGNLHVPYRCRNRADADPEAKPGPGQHPESRESHLRTMTESIIHRGRDACFR